ncbi:MAG: hypothetical protein HUU54_06035 [Ignavibacteriaceae bacterium]|nr:hypothetical protein [Ignavibacteriaceae bacterium]
MKFIYTTLFLLLPFSFSIPQVQLQKSSDDDNTKYTNVGNIGITLTNFGTYGHGFSKWPQQPSGEYPLGSGIEHIFDGGLYIGAFTSTDITGANKSGPFVTTGAVDAASVSARGGGFEWTNDPGSLVVERSSLLTSKFFSPLAVSHQDFIAEYLDTNKYLSNGELIENHSPLGLKVRQESYAWNFPFANFFVIMNYWVKNISNKYIDSIYIGLWTDAVVRNTKVTPPGGSTFYSRGGNGYFDSLFIAYEFDATGDIGLTDSYIGFQFLGADRSYDSVNFVSWQFRNTSDPNFFAPQDDISRYSKLQGYFGGSNRYNFNINPSSLKQPSNRSIMISAGSFSKLAPGDSMNVVFAIVAAKKFGNDPAALDTDEQKKNLYANAEWALRAYHGEDRNRNGILDPGEDADGNGTITRYILPTPPSIPKVKAIAEDRKVTLYWDKSSESSVDPISGKKDFEGYRVYRTNTGFDLTEAQNIQSSLIKFAEFDSLANNTGFNTGFSAISLNAPATFDGDTTKYFYKMEIDNLLNGWQYLFSVSAFDKKDEENNIESLESSSLTNIVRIVPGTPSTNDENIEIGVYPNPYYGNAYWDGSSERLRKLYFYNLPEKCDIYIYTLSGDIVKKINHDRDNNGSDLRWFQNYATDGKQQLSGGEQAWDLITDNDQAIATGLYLFTVKNLETGKIKTGKFLVIK